MYTNCLRCDKSLGRNSEIKHLAVGRRVAFEVATGRVWVICPSCDQWNLVPIEKRWEAVSECQRLADAAESRSKGKDVGFARTASGLELLRIDGHGDVDIANWRYGRRFKQRQSVLRWAAIALVGTAAIVGVKAGVNAGSQGLGLYVAGAVGIWLMLVWRQPPRLSYVVRTASRKFRIWWWQVQGIHTDVDDDGQVVVVVGRNRLNGSEAASFLSNFLAQVNGADCIGIPVKNVVQRIGAAEKASARALRAPTPIKPAPRPWEILASKLRGRGLLTVAPDARVALEMVATEECEQAELASIAVVLEDDVSSEKEIAAIADDLLLPDEIQADLSALTQHRKRNSQDSSE